MGRMGPNSETTETVGMGTLAIAMAIRKDECIKKN
jgi:hypothetical protein